MAITPLNCIGSVYSMTNEYENQVIYYMRDINGVLFSPTSYKTGGKGANINKVDPIDSQGSIILTPDHRFLFLVNAGNNTISSFIILEYGLKLVDVASSNGVFPISLTLVDNFLYVLNGGDKNNNPSVFGYKIKNNGHLSSICNSKIILNHTTRPSCITSYDNTNKLAITQPSSNAITIINVNKNGSLNNLVVNSPYGNNPTGAVYLSNNTLLVTNFPTASLSSYKICSNNTINTIDDSILSYQLGSCWVSVYPNENYAYVSNPDSGTVTSYRLSKEKKLTTIESVPTTPRMDGYAIDSAIDQIGKNLYVLNGHDGSITVYTITADGRLSLLQIYQDTKLPKLKSQGLASY